MPGTLTSIALWPQVSRGHGAVASSDCRERRRRPPSHAAKEALGQYCDQIIVRALTAEETLSCAPGVKGAMALSQAVIAGGAVAGVAVTLHKKHPHDPSRPLMDFDIALMLLPFLLLGVSLG